MAIPVWSLCDRCGQKYYSKYLRMESTGVLACESCYDGKWDKKRHPQNKPPVPRLNPKLVPDGRQQADLTQYLMTEDGRFLLTEEGNYIIATPTVWTPAMSGAR